MFIFTGTEGMHLNNDHNAGGARMPFQTASLQDPFGVGLHGELYLRDVLL